MNLETLRQLWSQREPRERAVLAAAVLFVAATLLYLMIEPAVSTIAELQHSLPNTRSQSAELEALLGEVRTLKARPVVAAAGSQDAQAAVEQSLAAAGLKAARVVPWPTVRCSLLSPMSRTRPGRCGSRAPSASSGCTPLP
jgi:type II secretory pathway component PulM